MTMTLEQIEQLKTDRLQKDIEKRMRPMDGATAFEQLDSEFSTAVNPLSTTDVAKVPRQQSDEAAVSELSPEEEDDELIAAALKNMASADRATTAFVERHKNDFYPSPETGAKMYGFLNEQGMDVTKETLEFAFSELSKQGVHLGPKKKYRSGLPANTGTREPEVQEDFVDIADKMRNAPTLDEGRKVLLEAMHRQRQRNEA